MTVPKILVLHGYSQNALIFSKRLGSLRKSCGKSVDFVFVDAPHVLLPVDLAGFSSPEALGAAETSYDTDPALAPRGWWRTNTDFTEANGLEESLMSLRDVLKGNQFEGVFGFSQGGAMAAVLTALLERPHLYPPFLVDNETPHPPFKFCISVAGLKCPGPIATTLFEPSYSTPTLHVLGKNDILVPKELSLRLLQVSANYRLEEHDGGHFVPSKANWRTFFRNFFTAENPFEILSPEDLSSSTPTSGTATPAAK